MNVDELLSQSLRGLAAPVDAGESLARRVLERVAEQSADSAQHPERRYSVPSRRPRLFNWPLRAGLAASLVGVAVAGWLLFAGGPPTVAEVEAAVAQQRWVHLAFDDGSEQWICLDDGRFFLKTGDGDYYFRDTATRTEQRYNKAVGEINMMKPQAWLEGVHRNGRVIPVETAELNFSDLDARKPTPETQAALQKVGVALEFDEVVDKGQKLGRFRESRVDALGEMQVQKEMWVDLKTKLPVRIRTRLNVRDQQRVGREYRTATYEFGETGPGNLHEVGVPRDAPIFRFLPRVEQFPLLTSDAQQALRGAAAAIRRFPPQFRLIELDDRLQLIYWSATAPQMQSFADGILGQSHSGGSEGSPLLLRIDHQLHEEPAVITALTTAASRPDAVVPADQIARWFPIARATNTELFDGKRHYNMTRFNKDVQLHVLPGAEYRWPSPFADGWEFANWNHSEFAPPKGEEPAPDGQLLIHSRRRDLKNNWYIDPAHDYTVARNVEWRLINEKWKLTMETRALAWQRTPNGSWYVSAWEVREPHVRQPDEGDAAPEFDVSRRRIEITPLETKDFPPDIFDGEKLQKRARKAGAEIKVD